MNVERNEVVSASEYLENDVLRKRIRIVNVLHYVGLALGLACYGLSKSSFIEADLTAWGLTLIVVGLVSPLINRFMPLPDRALEAIHDHEAIPQRVKQELANLLVKQSGKATLEDVERIERKDS